MCVKAGAKALHAVWPSSTRTGFQHQEGVSRPRHPLSEAQAPGPHSQGCRAFPPVPPRAGCPTPSRQRRDLSGGFRPYFPSSSKSWYSSLNRVQVAVEAIMRTGGRRYLRRPATTRWQLQRGSEARGSEERRGEAPRRLLLLLVAASSSSCDGAVSAPSCPPAGASSPRPLGTDTGTPISLSLKPAGEGGPQTESKNGTGGSAPPAEGCLRLPLLPPPSPPSATAHPQGRRASFQSPGTMPPPSDAGRGRPVAAFFPYPSGSLR